MVSRLREGGVLGLRIVRIISGRTGSLYARQRKTRTIFLVFAAHPLGPLRDSPARAILVDGVSDLGG